MYREVIRNPHTGLLFLQFACSRHGEAEATRRQFLTASLNHGASWPKRRRFQLVSWRPFRQAAGHHPERLRASRNEQGHLDPLRAAPGNFSLCLGRLQAIRSCGPRMRTYRWTETGFHIRHQSKRQIFHICSRDQVLPSSIVRYYSNREAGKVYR